MAQLVVDIEEGYSLVALKRAIALLKGVTNVLVKKDTVSPNVKETLEAIADAKAGRTIKCKDFEDYLEKVK